MLFSGGILVIDFVLYYCIIKEDCGLIVKVIRVINLMYLGNLMGMFSLLYYLVIVENSIIMYVVWGGVK